MTEQRAALGEAASAAEAGIRLHAAVHRILATQGSDNPLPGHDALEVIADTYDFEIVLHHELVDANRALCLSFSRGVPDAVVGRLQSVRLGETPCGAAAETAKPVVIDGAAARPAWPHESIRTLVALPLAVACGDDDGPEAAPRTAGRDATSAGNGSTKAANVVGVAAPTIVTAQTNGHAAHPSGKNRS